MILAINGETFKDKVTTNELVPCMDHHTDVIIGVRDIAPSHILVFVMKFVLGSF